MATYKALANWHLVHVFHQFSILTKFYLSHVYFGTLRIFSIKNCCACLNIARVGIVFQNTWTKDKHDYMFMVIIN